MRVYFIGILIKAFQRLRIKNQLNYNVPALLLNTTWLFLLSKCIKKR